MRAAGLQPSSVGYNTAVTAYAERGLVVEAIQAFQDMVAPGLGRIVALYYRSSTSYQNIRCFYF